MSEEEITDENYCDWRQSNCPLVKDYRARIAELEAALKPIKEAAFVGTNWADDDEMGLWVKVGDVRRLQAALKGEKDV